MRFNLSWREHRDVHLDLEDNGLITAGEPAVATNRSVFEFVWDWAADQRDRNLWATLVFASVATEATDRSNVWDVTVSDRWETAKVIAQIRRLGPPWPAGHPEAGKGYRWAVLKPGSREWDYLPLMTDRNGAAMAAALRFVGNPL